MTAVMVAPFMTPVIESVGSEATRGRRKGGVIR
jgi:hypothetical protein